MARPSRPNPEQTAIAEKNRVKAMDLHIAGFTYRQVAEQLGVSVSTAHSYVMDSLKKLAALREEKAEELRELEVQRLDDALRRIRTSEAYKDGEAAIMGQYIRLSESRRKLLGLDAPTKTDVTSGGEKITTFDVRIETPEDDE